MPEHVWVGELPWRPHQRGLAQYWAELLGWTQGEDWPLLFAFLAALEDEGHTALPWSRRQEFFSLVVSGLAPEGLAANFPLLQDRIPNRLFEGKTPPLKKIESGGETWIALGKNHSRETEVLKRLRDFSHFRPLWADHNSTHAKLTFLNPLQREAVAAFLKTGFLLLTGGPGTGKTTTIFQLLFQVLSRVPELRIAVAAPTGRAAARIRETLRESAQKLNTQENLSAREKILSLETTTLHRLLGLGRGLAPPRHDLDHPLPFDLVILDEATMVDLRLHHLFLRALGPSTALVLAGDPDQLPSVEAGGVFRAMTIHPETAAFARHLTENLRLEPQSGRLSPLFAALAHALPETAADALEETARNSPENLRWFPDVKDEDMEAQARQLWLEEAPRDWRTTWVSSCVFFSREDAETKLEPRLRELERLVLLSATHEGPGGTRRLGETLSVCLGQEKEGVYPGLPWMVTRNLSWLKLNNGDRGLVIQVQGRFLVAFRDPSGPPRLHPLGLLADDGEASWALTVHKSQGSEFRTVIFCLPAEGASRFLRPHLYTGVTRAREKVLLLASRPVVLQTLGNSGVRSSTYDAELSTMAHALPSHRRPSSGEGDS